MKSFGRFSGVILILLFVSNPGFTQPGLESTQIGIDEKLGEYVPLKTAFFDENADSVLLGDFINKPTILAFVYYDCPGICTPLLNGLVDVLEKYDGLPGKDYSVVTISINELDNPVIATQKKKSYLASFRKEFPETEWHFLTGDTTSITAVTNAVGFRYERKGKDFIHPGLLTILSPDGKIIRYLFGITFNQFDLKMAVTEALAGKPGPTIAKVLQYCFSYDPDGRTYAFNFLKVTGTLVLFFVLIFAVYLFFASKIRRKSKGYNGNPSSIKRTNI